ncbi:PREDICTED: cystatin-C [Chrysochloris asiatica]|uniref:Cystatin-C n=1 Tax=Chrysochloris asiatica TaxID=185453 RepID=A0A9B0TBF6_CHRAS|nr:PREDICTED: cystatin-C [Chrysochloris asiatica]
MAVPLRASLLLLAALALAGILSPAGAANAGPPRLMGGIMDADENEQGVQRALDFAISEYNKASNDKFHSRLVQLVRARKQIVSGVKYYLDVELGRTTCTKSQPNLTTCPFHDQPQLKKKAMCSFQVYTVPWLETTSLIKSSCQSA